MKADPLADVPPEDFIRARNALVKELRGAGKGAEAKALAARRRPPPSVWTVNRVAREEPRAVARLLAAGKALAAAQRGLLRGGDIGKMREAETELRSALGAVEEMIASGNSLSAAVLRRIGDTLRAAATGDEETRAALKAGRLEEDLDPATGFGSLTGVKVAARAPKAATGEKKKAKPQARDARAERQAAAREAKQREAQRREEAREAKRREAQRKQAARLAAEAEKAERRARELRERATEAAAGLGA